MKQKKVLVIGAIALFIIILITLFFAPNNNQQQSGSTYNRQPDGYAAWYEYMIKKGVKIKRGEKPFQQLIKENNSPITLVKIQPLLDWYYQTNEELNFVKKGNNLIILGVKQLVTKANFITMQNTDLGMIKIETSRRANNQSSTQSILKDNFGDIVWKKKINKGEITQIVTPYFAANAYQDYSANYEFLAKLVTQYNQPIWVDEYLHGYKDKEVIKQEIGEDLFSYLSKKPLLIIFIQSIILLLVCIWGFNYYFGKPITLSVPKINNSKAYIDALAAVLQKAESSDFLLEIIGKEERLQLQKQLGLGSKLLDSQTLLDVWQNQEGNKKELQSLLSLQSKKSIINNTILLKWLNGWQKLRN
jgi:hypothetical protein